MGDKSSTGNREATACPETEVTGTEAERTDFLVTAFPSEVAFLLFSPKSQQHGLVKGLINNIVHCSMQTNMHKDLCIRKRELCLPQRISD